jgi:tetratricopeptide (TPR) repeat protein
MTPRILTALLAILVAACAVTAYLGSFNNGYIWDDPIVLNQQMVAFRSVGDAFKPPLRIPQFGLYYYRPLVVISYMIDKAFTGPRPMDLPAGSINPFHVSVVLYHTIVTVLVFFFGRALFHARWWGQWAAFAGALLFAVHPIHTESVCWMAGRSDVIAAIGLIGALTLFVLGRRYDSPALFIAAGAAYLAGLLSKETGIAVLLALPALAVIPVKRLPGRSVEDPDQSSGGKATTAKASGGAKRRKKGHGRKKARRSVSSGRRTSAVPCLIRYGPFVAATIIYWMMRYQDLGRTSGGRSLSSLVISANFQAQRARLNQTVLDLLAAVGFYVRKVFVPTHLNAFISEVPDYRFMVLLGITALVGFAVLGYFSYRRGARIGIALGVVFFATVAPSMAIAAFSISEAPVAERYLYMPSVAVCLGVPYLIGFLIEHASARWGKMLARACLAVAVAAGIVLLATFGYATSVRNETWRDDLVFWEDAVAKAPHQGLPHLHLGLAYDRMPYENDEERLKWDSLAEREFKLALDEENVVYDIEGRSTAWNNLANVYMSRGEYDEAERAFNNSIKMRPRYHTPHYGLGLLAYRRSRALQRQGDGAAAYTRMEEADQWLQKAIRLNPRYVKAHLLAGQVLMALRQTDRARRHLQEVVRLDAGSTQGNRAKGLLDQLSAATSSGTSPPGGGQVAPAGG